jgi:hypothetical protein
MDYRIKPKEKTMTLNKNTTGQDKLKKMPSAEEVKRAWQSQIDR